MDILYLMGLGADWKSKAYLLILINKVICIGGRIIKTLMLMLKGIGAMGMLKLHNSSFNNVDVRQSASNKGYFWSFDANFGMNTQTVKNGYSTISTSVGFGLGTSPIMWTASKIWVRGK
ncbi:hypothetical protein [Chryseobacterium arthrosphaerae]|uniref:hypothetical protein n=1 Tax=Chryseobacterium arthrosphaerae TaxID=651561 RepID=UPI00241E242D|nr:hypothetical protein [Chryseobacterium arthrosphaerae]